MLNIKSKEYRDVALAMNYELEAVFKRNMDFFKKEDKKLYQTALGYKPKRMTLRLDPKGYINLYNLQTNQPVYPIEPNEYAEKQVARFFEKRPHFTISVSLGSELKDEYPYSKCIHAMHEKYSELLPTHYSEKQTLVDNLFMFGGGLYLQLQYILNKLDVKRLTIFETDFDSFYASLHTLDWSEIYRYFGRDGYSLDLMFITDTEESYLKIGRSMLNHGIHRYSKIDLFFHYKNNEIDYVYNQIKHYAKFLVSTMGYFEDERVGLAHTFKNVVNGCLYSKHSMRGTTQSELPVVIVGNGPSIDQTAEFLKSNSDRFIIISCGTALSTLYKKGIKPDIHVEQERVSIVKSLLEENTSQKYRDEVVFFGLNTCHPDVYKLFPQRYMILKSNDMGVDILSMDSDPSLAIATNCNPLVSNFGLSLASMLGFKNIYLAGVDCGFRDKTKHHSEDSFYFDAQGNSIVGDGITENAVEANFGGLVETNDLFSRSKSVLEIEISEAKLNIKNLSDGAMINGAAPCSVSEVKLGRKITDKQQVIKELTTKVFDKNNESSLDLHKNIDNLLNIFNAGISKISQLLKIEEKSLSELYESFDEIEAKLKGYSIACPAMYRLVNGSVRGMMINVIVAKKTLPAESFSKFKVVAEESLELFFDEIQEQMNSILLDVEVLDNV